MNAKILIADDESDIVSMLGSFLKQGFPCPARFQWHRSPKTSRKAAGYYFA